MTSTSGPKFRTRRPGPATHIKEAIMDEMRSNNITQTQMAKDLHMSNKHVSQVLTGKVQGTFGVLIRLAQYVGLEIVAIKRVANAKEQ